MGWFKAKANPAVPADTKIIPPYPHPTLNLNKLENEEPTTQFIQWFKNLILISNLIQKNQIKKRELRYSINLELICINQFLSSI